jgi:hypothetical protein
MLVANRDPFHPGTHDANDAVSPHGRGAVPGLVRTMTMLQVVGSLLAIPVGIGSAYSFYRANFSVETTCQSLRGNIVAMLDRRVDATTRHMLVRHDVESFERACGAVDPDATAAFKALLTAENMAAPVVKQRHVEARSEPIGSKAEPKQEATAKPKMVPSTGVAVEAVPAEHDVAVSDAAWIAAVRSALVTDTSEATPNAVVEPPSASQTRPAVVPATREVHALNASAQAPIVVAPALPPAMSIAAPAPHQQADDHPVPPASIPYAGVVVKENGERSRLGELVAQIPLVGRALDAIDGKSH